MYKAFTALLAIFWVINIHAQNVGIGTTAAQSKLDINGDLALRTGVLQCNAGENINKNTTTNRFSNYAIQLTGNGSFTINGLNGGTDGRLLNIYNSTDYAFTIFNEYTNTVIPTNRILTGSDTQLVIYPKNTVSLRYDGSINRWLVTGTHRSDLWIIMATIFTILILEM